MNADPDDEALSWGDESDPTYVDPANPAAKNERSARSTKAEAPHRADETVGESEPAASSSMSSPMLLAVGILAGAYLLYTAGWFISAGRNIAMPVGALDVFMFQLREYLAVLAPAAWFGATLLLTRHTKPVTRLLGLVLGAIVLLPIPFLLGE
jgi:hypothetical protein